ncbi:MAG: PQQ-binding-like beta-propeller repeat protein, partial [Candidatus Brocadiae bacterium]|nr:PQQ-binding-like beta-propeller repeat protein [Candidatus Brocadiia bacterium]
WAVRGPGRIRPPDGVASLSTDGRRIFTLVAADPDGRTPRLIPAAIDTDADPPATAWSGFGSAGDLFDDGWAMGPPLLAAGRLYVPTALRDATMLAPGLVCLDAATGRRIWATVLGEDMGPAARQSLHPQSPRPVLWGGRLFVGNGGRVIGALDAATGDLEWVHVAARRVYALAGGPPAPAAFEGGVLYPEMGTGWLLRADSGAVTAIPPSPFQPHWCVTAGVRTALFGDDGATAAAGGPRGFAELLNRSGGRGVLYELPDPPAGRPALWGETLTVPTTRGLLSVDLPSGEVRVLAEWGPGDAGDLVRLPGWVVILRGGSATFRKVQE